MREDTEDRTCATCGWYRHPGRSCDMQAFEAAEAISKLTRTPFTKLGYGQGRIAFEFDGRATLVLDLCYGSVSVDRIFWWKRGAEGCASLVNAITGISFHAEEKDPLAEELKETAKAGVKRLEELTGASTD